MIKHTNDDKITKYIIIYFYIWNDAKCKTYHKENFDIKTFIALHH